MVCETSSEHTFRKEEHDTIIANSRHRDEYGFDKRVVEQRLEKKFADEKFPITILRLPDVFGPFDSTLRFWCYYMWAIVSEKDPIFVSTRTEPKNLSFVFRDDVVHVILKVLQTGKLTFGQKYNVSQVIKHHFNKPIMS